MPHHGFRFHLLASTVIGVLAFPSYAAAQTYDARPDGGEVTGTGRADVFRGGAGDDVFMARGGADTFRGARGDDFLLGGRGPDRARGEGGTDFLIGGLGHDVLRGGRGVDRLFGVAPPEPGARLGDGGNLLVGGSGDDHLVGSTGPDHMLAGDGEDSLTGLAGRDLMRGGDGDDRFGFGDSPAQAPMRQAETDGAVARGGRGSDVFEVAGDDGPVTIVGGPGADVVGVLPGAPLVGMLIDLRGGGADLVECWDPGSLDDPSTQVLVDETDIFVECGEPRQSPQPMGKTSNGVAKATPSR